MSFSSPYSPYRGTSPHFLGSVDYVCAWLRQKQLQYSRKRCKTRPALLLLICIYALIFSAKYERPWMTFGHAFSCTKHASNHTDRLHGIPVRHSEGPDPKPNPTEPQRETDIFLEADFMVQVTHSDTVAWDVMFSCAVSVFL